MNYRKNIDVQPMTGHEKLHDKLKNLKNIS